jgi:acetyl-CoA carboxylase carboxyl transferase subunit alpha
MNLDYLDFEQPIAELEDKIEALENIKDKEVDISQEIEALEDKSSSLTRKIFASLSDWQIAQLARHVGQQKGRTTQEKIKHNFGMPKPEGYRKALRLMKMAEKFSMPIITFIDTPGAYPGIGAEERGQSEAIAKNLFEMSTLATPIVSVVIGEGGSGGALAIGVADRMMMFEYSIYSVISPEGCASILYKDASKANIAAESLKLTSSCLKDEGLINSIISEPLGGIHRNPEQAKILLREALKEQLEEVNNINIEQLLQERAEKLLSFGRFKDQG